MTVRPTVIPATASPIASSDVYFGSQFKIGSLLYNVFFLKTFLAFPLHHKPIDFNWSEVDFLVLSVTGVYSELLINF